MKTRDELKDAFVNAAPETKMKVAVMVTCFMCGYLRVKTTVLTAEDIAKVFWHEMENELFTKEMTASALTEKGAGDDYPVIDQANNPPGL